METRRLALPTKKWWVCFTKTELHRWWWYHLIPSYRPPFQHVYACCEAGENLLMFIDPQNNGAAVSIILGRPTDHIKFVLKTGGKVLYVERPDWHDELDDREIRYRRGWTITCASVIAYFMALDTRVQTPKGLFNLLLQDYGAVELERRYGRRRRRPEPETGSAAGADAGGRDPEARGVAV